MFLNFFKEKHKIIKYNISFNDSGVGGLIFADDIYDELISDLYYFESKYYIKFNLYHIGDVINAPYGVKQISQIRDLTYGLINYAAKKLNSKIAVIACNSASVVFDNEYKEYINQSFPEASVMPIIKKSAKKLYDEGKIIINNYGQKEIHLGILATKATIESSSYEKQLRDIHKSKNPNIKLYTYFYYPDKWVENIENNSLTNKNIEDVNKDLLDMFKKFPNAKKISALGLFCTHFPFLQKEILNFFIKETGNNVKIINQGLLFATNIKQQIIKDLDKANVKMRDVILKNNREIKIKSLITGKKNKEIRSFIKNMFPDIYHIINIKNISKIKEFYLQK